jgi:atypical dual specificity phosphatase
MDLYELVYYKGCLVISVPKEKIEHVVHNIPSEYVKCKMERDGENYHMTVITSHEVLPEHANIVGTKIGVVMIGIGNSNNCYYIVCSSPQGDEIRMSLKLSHKDFHITLGFNGSDVHDISKNIHTVSTFFNGWHKLVAINQTKCNVKNLKFLEMAHSMKNLDSIQSLDVEDNALIIIAYAKVLANMGNISAALSTLLPLLLYSDEYKLKYYNIVHKIKVSTNTVTLEYMEQLKASLLNLQNISPSVMLSNFLSNLQKNNLKEFNIENRTILMYDENLKAIVQANLPRNFSYVTPTLCGSGSVSEKYIKQLVSIGITDVICLTETITTTYTPIKCHHFPIDDRKGCDVDVLFNILQKINECANPLVHCVGGIGRTNMVLASYLINANGISPSEAVTMLSKNRKVIMTSEQMLTLNKFYGQLNSDQLVSKQNITTYAGLIMMNGLPASGKTTLSLAFMRAYGDKIVHVCQDDLGKHDSINVFNDNIKKNVTLILDRCNLSIEQRGEWLTMYKQITSKPIVCITFGFSPSVCGSRVANRSNHPTLSGEGGVKIINNLASQFEMARLEEGFKEIIYVNNDDDLKNLYDRFGLTMDEKIVMMCNRDELKKFPRTKHLCNLGAMGRDDLLYSKKELDDFLNSTISVEEKVDGANLGIFLNSENKIIVQNRSHFVSPDYHPQFKLINKWIESHREDLMYVLSLGNYIMYGEWLYMKHSINYTMLPDYFIMFDLYDRDTNTFFSRDTVENIIENTSISLARTLFTGSATIDQLKQMVKTKSAYYDGEIEGIYVRTFEGNKLKYRGKIVRTDFICGDEHWAKNKYVINTVIK